MLKTRTARFAATITGAAFAFSTFAPVAGAATVAELQAQINALMAQLSAMSGGSTSVTFNTDLTVGSKGADVTALQNWLIKSGYGIAAGATGYFGAQTKSAVAAWQAAAGIAPAVGYFGPKSRAAANQSANASVPGTGGNSGNTGSTGITTPGAEGTLTVISGPVPNNTVYAGDRQVAVIAFQAKAQSSDIALQRVQVNLGTNTTMYNKIFSTLYVVDDAGRALASIALNSNTVVKSGSNYLVTITGFSSVIPKNATRNYTIAADLYPAIDSTFRTTYTPTIDALGIRGVDGAGIDLYAPATGTTLSNSVLVSANLSDSATMTLSTNSATPLTQEVVAADGSSLNQKDKVAMLVFDVRAASDDVTITDLTTTTTVTGPASASSTYLYAGNGTTGTLINSAAAVTGTGVATFSTINQVVPKNTTKTFTIATDVRNATAVQTTFAVSVTTVTAQSSTGTTVSPTGTATSNSFLVRNIGPVFTLASAPTAVKGATASQNNTSTSTVNSTFVVNIQALGGDIYFGTQAASSTFGTRLYQGGAVDSQAVSSTTSYVVPSTGVVTTGLPGASVAFKLAQNQSTQVTVSVYTEGRIAATSALVTGASYTVALDNINWSTNGTSNFNTSSFMRGKTNWQTNSVQLP